MYRYEITQESNGWVIRIFKDDKLFMYQPHHPQQELTEDQQYWTSREEAEAWANQTIEEFSSPSPIEHYNEAPVGITIEDQIANLRAQLELLESQNN